MIKLKVEHRSNSMLKHLEITLIIKRMAQMKEQRLLHRLMQLHTLLLNNSSELISTVFQQQKQPSGMRMKFKTINTCPS